jgi:hypothetical protein
VAAAIKQGLKQLYFAAREGASVPAGVLEALTSGIRALALPACGPTAANPTAAAAAAAAAEVAAAGNKRKHGAAMTGAEGTGAGSSKQPRLQKPPPAGSDGRPGVWLDEAAEDDGCWVQLGDHIFMEVDGNIFMRDPASFKVAAAAAATAEDAGGAAGSSSKCTTNKSSRNKHSSSSSNSSSSTHLVWLFRVEHFEGNFIKGRFYQNAARDFAQPLQLQRNSQRLCSDKISSILHVLQPTDSSSKALETLIEVEAEWLQQVQAGLCC